MSAHQNPNTIQWQCQYCGKELPSTIAANKFCPGCQKEVDVLTASTSSQEDISSGGSATDQAHAESGYKDYEMSIQEISDSEYSSDERDSVNRHQNVGTAPEKKADEVLNLKRKPVSSGILVPSPKRVYYGPEQSHVSQQLLRGKEGSGSAQCSNLSPGFTPKADNRTGVS